MEKKSVEVWITKWALTFGVIGPVEAVIENDVDVVPLQSVRGHSRFLLGGNAFESKMEAFDCADEMAAKEAVCMKKKLARYENFSPWVVPHSSALDGNRRGNRAPGQKFSPR